MENTAETNLTQTSRSTNYHGVEYPTHVVNSLYIKTCGIQRCIPGFSFYHTRQEGYFLHVVLSGRGILKAGGRETEIHEGQIFLLRDQEKSRLEADAQNPWHYVWIAYGGSHAQRMMKYAGFTDGIYALECHIPPMKFHALVKEILEHPHLNLSSELHRMSLALQFLSMTIESREIGQEGPKMREDLSTDDYVAYAARYIQANFSNIRISDVASYIGINRTYLTTLFKKKMLMSPQEYLMHVRMDRSRTLLRDTNIPVSAVAREVGYDDQLAFSKIFKKKFGVSPAQYRRKSREDHPEAAEQTEKTHCKNGGNGV